MERQQLRAALSLAAVFSVRLLGLFMIYPVFASYAGDLTGANPYLIGEALGIYGLTQGLLQIPFGLLSDKVGRKVMIVIGLILFAIGSAVAALSTSIDGVIVGRALQGAGAVGSVILALVADLTAEENRTKAMALVGVTIGGSFMVALVAGPIVASFVGVAGIFWLMVVLALIGILITQFVVPNPPRLRVHRDAEAVPAMIGAVLRDSELLRLDFGIFALHAMLTASFLVVPGLLRGTLDIAVGKQWMVYLPVLVVSVVVMVPAIVVAEKYRRMKGVFVGAVAALFASQVMLLFRRRQFVCSARGAGGVLLRVQRDGSEPAVADHQGGAGRRQGHGDGALFEPAVPRHLRRRRRRRLCQCARRRCRGVCAHRGAGAGLACRRRHHGAAELSDDPAHSGRRRQADAESLAAKLRQVPGVAEAVVIAEDKLAYLKVDSKAFDAKLAASLAGAS